MAAGSTHCLALTEDSEVHSWGNNDQCQHFDTLHQTKPEPSLLPGLDTKHIVGIACGPAQVLRAAAPGPVVWVPRRPPRGVPSRVLCRVSLSGVCATRLFPVPPHRPGLADVEEEGRVCPGLGPAGAVPSSVISCGGSRPVAGCVDAALVLVSPQSFAWSSCSEWSVGLRVPFVVDVCSGTFEQLDLLLRQVSEGMDGTADWPPPQEKECVAVATLNLLRLQVGARPPWEGCPRVCWDVHERKGRGFSRWNC